jgi:hypothetical protein
MQNTSVWTKTERLANVSIILVSCLIVVVLARSYLFAKPAAHPKAEPPVPAGTAASLAGIDWSANRKTLLVSLKSGCRFCAASAPFYQRLVKEAPARRVKLIALLPQSPEEGRGYLKSLDVDIVDVMDVRELKPSVRVTPTIYLVDSRGVITDSWRGLLGAEEEARVLAQLE